MDSTTFIISFFEQISTIPRGSKNETGIRSWLLEWAAVRGLSTSVDEAGNLVIRVPASVGYENRPVLVLQGHMDMVCEKIPGSPHDFRRDPIRLVRDGDWIRADGTTLGADNGIGLALMLALAADENVQHPPLELLFTVEEERGLVGANNLDPAMLTGKILVNLDSEEEGVLTIGGAGGGVLTINLPVQWEALRADETVLRLTVGRLQGGHSGDDIHKHRANANKLLARLLDGLLQIAPLRLAALKGGSARNAIPRDASAVLACPPGTSRALVESFVAQSDTLRAELAQAEPNLSLALDVLTDRPEYVIGLADTETAIRLLVALPNGVASFSAEIPGFVETSNNVGVVELGDNGFVIASSHRSAVISRLEDSINQAAAVAWLAEAETERSKVNPPWTPAAESPLLEACVRTYQSVFGVEPKVKLIHAGLECGILSNRCGGLDAISLGPTVKSPHSPDERLYVPSLSKVWDFLRALLAAGLD